MKTDLEIQQNVIEELKWQPFLNSAKNCAAVLNGIVTLSGTVDSHSKMTPTEIKVKKVAEVKVVVEEIEVNFPGISRKTDSDVTEAVLNALYCNIETSKDEISVKVEHSFVTLEGEVECEFQRDFATSMVEYIADVRSIMNRIKIKAKITPIEIKQKIAHAFHRSAALYSDNINIEIVGNKAILRGRVRLMA